MKRTRSNILHSLLFFFLCLSAGVYAQGPDTRSTNTASPRILCSSDQLMTRLRKDSVFREQEKKMNAEILRITLNGVDEDTIITLPIVFHVIDPNPAAITDAQLYSALSDLNDAFGKTGAYAASLGADTKIRFCLAQKDPNGGVSTGITRTTSFYASDMNMNTEDKRLKNLVQWDPQHYINIWIVRNINGEISADFSCGTWSRMNAGGYATMPPGGGITDGIVVTGFGPLLAHEMGHYLGLYHTFEGGCTNNNCLTDGDRVCDTPPDASIKPSASCSLPSNSCTTDTLSSYSNGAFYKDVPDQIANFMDYGNSACSNEFTAGQKARMRAAINTQRMGLLDNQCNKPCNTAATAGFTRNLADPVTGSTIRFTNTSAGAGNYEWLVNDVVVSTATDLSYTFNTASKSKVTLKAYDNAACFASYTDYVITGCGVTARFANNKKTIASKTGLYTDSIFFKNNSVNASSYQWIISNDKGMAEQVVSTATDLNYVFPDPANYSVKLIASNGSCSDTTESLSVSVLDPTPDGYLYFGTVYCYQQTKLRVNFSICNSGYAPIPKNTPISFYDADPRTGAARKLEPTYYLPDDIPGNCCGVTRTHIIDVTYPNLNRLYAVFNDSGKAVPVSLPNTPYTEKNYTNNFTAVSNFQFRVTALPPSATLEPGDTLQLTAQTFPDPGSTSAYTWSNAYLLSCTSCRSPFLYADSNRTKQVIAVSQYQCRDTAYIDIKVPPADDYTIVLNSASCAGSDSIMVAFTLKNGFKRGVLPKGLTVSFYDNDPSAGSANLLPAKFILTDTVFAKQKSFVQKIKKMPQGRLYAAVNGDAKFSEKNYSNDTASVLYIPPGITVYKDICPRTSYLGYNQTGTYIDTFKLANGCDSIRTLHLFVRSTTSQQYITICEGQSYFAGGHAQVKSGVFADMLASSFGCDSMVITHLTVAPIPRSFLPPDTLLCINNVLQLNIPGYVSYAWSNGTTAASTGIGQPGIYGLQVTDKYGCTGTDSISVGFYDCIPIQVPSAFTPNGDGLNDVFRPLVTYPLANYRMQVWNRWGQLVFETREYSRGWNGTLAGLMQPAGAYVYNIIFNDTQGIPIVKKGTVVLIR